MSSTSDASTTSDAWIWPPSWGEEQGTRSDQPIEVGSNQHWEPRLFYVFANGPAAAFHNALIKRVRGWLRYYTMKGCFRLDHHVHPCGRRHKPARKLVGVVQCRVPPEMPEEKPDTGATVLYNHLKWCLPYCYLAVKPIRTLSHWQILVNKVRGGAYDDLRASHNINEG